MKKLSTIIGFISYGIFMTMIDYSANTPQFWVGLTMLISIYLNWKRSRK